MATRNPTIDIMKGIAIIAVIAGHILPGGSYGHKLIYSFHMPLFFLIAGYLYKPSTIYKKKLVTDFRRLIVPYLVVATIFTIILTRRSFLPGLEYSVIATIWGEAYHHHSLIWSTAPHIGTAWFLPALFWCRQVFNLIFTRVMHPNIIITLLSIISVIVDYYFINLPFALLPGMSAMLFYLIGYRIRFVLLKKSFYILLFVLGFVCWTLHMHYSTIDMCICLYGIYPIDVAGALFATASIYFISQWISFTSLGKILDRIGQISLYIFCFHAVEKEINPYGLLPFDKGWYTEVVIRTTWCVIAAFVYVSIKKNILIKHNTSNSSQKTGH